MLQGKKKRSFASRNVQESAQVKLTFRELVVFAMVPYHLFWCSNWTLVAGPFYQRAISGPNVRMDPACSTDRTLVASGMGHS